MLYEYPNLDQTGLTEESKTELSELLAHINKDGHMIVMRNDLVPGGIDYLNNFNVTPSGGVSFMQNVFELQAAGSFYYLMHVRHEVMDKEVPFRHELWFFAEPKSDALLPQFELKPRIVNAGFVMKVFRLMHVEDLTGHEAFDQQYELSGDWQYWLDEGQLDLLAASRETEMAYEDGFLVAGKRSYIDPESLLVLHQLIEQICRKHTLLKLQAEEPEDTDIMEVWDDESGS